MKFIYYFIYFISTVTASYKIISISHDTRKKLIIRKSYIDELNYNKPEYSIQKPVLTKEEKDLNFDEVLKKIGSDLCKVNSYNYLFINSTSTNNSFNSSNKNVIDENILHFFLRHEI